MKVELYGQPYNQTCQNATRLLKSAQINVKFFNLDYYRNKKFLIQKTAELQKQAKYIFKTEERSPTPIVICDETKEVLAGYYPGTRMYDNIFKAAGIEELDTFTKKYSEYKRKNQQKK